MQSRKAHSASGTASPYRISDTASVYMGRLMTPHEVSKSIQQRTADEIARIDSRRWFLCGDVHPTMFKHLKATTGPKAQAKHKTTLRISAFTTPFGAGYAVLTHEIQRCQHRLVLPLYEPAVVAFLKASEHDDHAFSLGNNNLNDAVVLPSTETPAHLFHLTAFCSEPDTEQAQLYVAELAQVVMRLCEIDAVPSVDEAKPVTEVSLSVIVPTQTIAQMEVAGATIQ